MISKTTKKTTYKATAIGFAAFFALMMTPSGAFSTSTDSAITAYGMAEVVQRNGDGEILSSSVVHNRLLDAGEEFTLNAIFRTTGTGPTDANRIDQVCISSTDGETVLPTVNGVGTDPLDDALTTSDFTLVTPVGAFNACAQSAAAITLAGDGTAVIGPLTFTTGEQITVGQTVDTVLVCYGDDVDGACTTAFAAVDVTDVSPTGTDTVDVTYTFDLSSSMT
ncbi:hypothetical protein CENSYa_0355 [Cenarchaeum symbiosum A]|uniref:Uncharacterized protein n=1 Tax=Cenarchaeum symbiosum (strain A) TaxID=414004 RepID=A0RUH4_CENSY|nr:hypothetical protein CENSYa_0355 [Cenarchaeum symbiosum A]